MKWILLNRAAQSAALSLAVFILCFAPRAFGVANAVHSHENIVDLATRFALDSHAGKEKVEVRVSAPDKRLHLPACYSDLAVFWPPGAAKTGHSTVGVRCEGATQWKIHLRAFIKIYDYVAVLSSTVNKDDLVSEGNISIELMDLSNVRGETMRDISPVIGHRFTRRVASGRALTKSVLALPRLIRKGEDVVIVANAGLLNVRMKGVALEDGEQGGMVRVRNLSSERIIQGQVVGRGKILVSY